MASGGAPAERCNPARSMSSVSIGRIIHAPSTSTESLWRIIPRNSTTRLGRWGTEGGNDFKRALICATADSKSGSASCANAARRQSCFPLLPSFQKSLRDLLLALIDLLLSKIGLQLAADRLRFGRSRLSEPPVAHQSDEDSQDQRRAPDRLG